MKNGEFIKNEPFRFNGIEDSRVAIAVTSYGLQDVKSVYAGPDLGNVGSAKSFVSDVVQKDQFIFGSAVITEVNGKTGLAQLRVVIHNFPAN